MRTLQIEWDLSLAPELRQAMEPYVKRYLDILPPWCHTLQIFADRDPEEKGESFIRIAADYKYRRAAMFVQAEFLEKSLNEREQTIVHEFVHAINAPMTEFEDTLIDLVEEKEAGMKDMLIILQSAGMEAATEDMAMLIWSLTKDRREDVGAEGNQRTVGEAEPDGVRAGLEAETQVRSVQRGKRTRHQR